MSIKAHVRLVSIGDSNNGPYRYETILEGHSSVHTTVQRQAHRTCLRTNLRTKTKQTNETGDHIIKTNETEQNNEQQNHTTTTKRTRTEASPLAGHKPTEAWLPSLFSKGYSR